jgi:hypothetical protein
MDIQLSLSLNYPNRDHKLYQTCLELLDKKTYSIQFLSRFLAVLSSFKDVKLRLTYDKLVETSSSSTDHTFYIIDETTRIKKVNQVEKHDIMSIIQDERCSNFILSVSLLTTPTPPVQGSSGQQPKQWGPRKGFPGVQGPSAARGGAPKKNYSKTDERTVIQGKKHTVYLGGSHSKKYVKYEGKYVLLSKLSHLP